MGGEREGERGEGWRWQGVVGVASRRSGAQRKYLITTSKEIYYCVSSYPTLLPLFFFFFCYRIKLNSGYIAATISLPKSSDDEAFHQLLFLILADADIRSGYRIHRLCQGLDGQNTNTCA